MHAIKKALVGFSFLFALSLGTCWGRDALTNKKATADLSSEKVILLKSGEKRKMGDVVVRARKKYVWPWMVTTVVFVALFCWKWYALSKIEKFEDGEVEKYKKLNNSFAAEIDALKIKNANLKAPVAKYIDAFYAYLVDILEDNNIEEQPTKEEIEDEIDAKLKA